MGKKNKTPMGTIIVGIIIIAVAAVALGFVDLPEGFSAVNIPAATTPTTAVVCDSTTSPTVTYNIYDSVKAGTKLSSDYNQNVYINGFFLSETTAGTGFEANPGDVVTLYLEDVGGAHDVFGFVDTFTVECKENHVVNSERGMQDGALTTTVYQSDDITANTAAAREAIGAGGTVEARIKVKESTDDAYWSTTEGGQKVLLVADVNASAWSDFEVISADPSTAVAEVPAPTGHTDVNATTGGNAIAFEITSNALRDLGTLQIYVRAPALSGVNPTPDSDIYVTFYDKELYQNTNDGEWYVAYVNAVDNSDLGETNATDGIHVS